MRFIYTSKGMSKVWGARYLSKNTAFPLMPTKVEIKFKEYCALKICMIIYAFDFKEHCSLRGTDENKAMCNLILRNEVFM
jgi:hypothetical protein